MADLGFGVTSLPSETHDQSVKPASATHRVHSATAAALDRCAECVLPMAPAEILPAVSPGGWPGTGNRSRRPSQSRSPLSATSGPDEGRRNPTANPLIRAFDA